MPRFTHKENGSVINVSDETADQLGSAWESSDTDTSDDKPAPKKAAAKKAAAKGDADAGGDDNTD